MTDGFALFIVIIGAVVIMMAKMLSHGEYDQQITLPPGTYLVGEDIPHGKCDVLAESGSGNFCVKNRKSRSWSIGSNIGITSPQQPGRFRNLVLNIGDTLEVNGNVVILLKDPIPIRNVADETLGPGVYRFGLDVPAGKYDLEIASGDGDVLLVDVTKDHYTFYQDMSTDNPFKPASFVNVTCTKIHELWVNGNLQVRLKYSKKQPGLLRKLLLIQDILFEEKEEP